MVMGALTPSSMLRLSDQRVLIRLIAQACVALLIAGMLWIVTSSATPAFAGEDVIHIVQPGETLSSIASRYGVSYVTIARHNGIVNPNLLRSGQRLRIPRVSANPAPKRAPQTPTPQNLAYNRPTAPPVVQAVQPKPQPRTEPGAGAVATPVATPKPPTPTPTPTRTPRIHVVQAFETLTSIAARYGTTVYAIKRRNGLPTDTIYRGQRLIIP